MTPTITDASFDYLSNAGFDPVNEACPLKRKLQRKLETILARGILSGEFDEGDTVVVDCIQADADSLSVTRAPCPVNVMDYKHKID